jgi:hypothetical protein
VPGRTDRSPWFTTGINALLLWCLFFALSPSAVALTHETQLNDVMVTVFAPDWTWQNRDVNILLVLENEGEATREVFLGLALPAGQEDDFGLPEGSALTHTTTMGPGDTVRQAFTKITAEPDAELQTYSFAIEVVVDGERTAIPYPLRTIRGAVSRGSVWVALLVPCGVALIWCVAFALALRRFAKPGAWKTPSGAFEEPEQKEPWIDQSATS